METLQSSFDGYRNQNTLSVSIVIPAYNEEHGIGPVLTQLNQVMVVSGLCYEIIVVDDGSHDRTVDVVKQYEKTAVLYHRENRGYGAALKTGIRYAHFNLICITDADGTYPVQRIPDLVSQLVKDGYDMVIGTRIGNKVAVPLVRRPAKWILRRLAGLLAGESIPDLNSGLRVFRREPVLRFFSILPDGFSFTTTVTLAMLTSGYLVGYVPINYYVRIGHSKIRPIRDTLNFVQLVFQIALYFVPLKIFLPLSGLMLLLALSWALFSMFILGKLADVSTLVIAMTGVQIAVIGILAELINKRLPNIYKEK